MILGASRRLGWAPAAFGLPVLLVLAACASPLTLQARLASMLVGVTACNVVRVYGPPTRVERDGDVDRLVYQWTVDNIQGIVEPSASYLPSRGERTVDVDCEVRMETRQSVVTGVDAKGWTSQSRNVARECARMFLAIADTLERSEAPKRCDLGEPRGEVE